MDNVEELLNTREVLGSENAVRTMLFYYITALQSVGIEDTKQYIASRIGDMISLSEEQVKFILSNFYEGDKLVESLNSSIELLVDMNNKKEYDEDTLNIVINLLNMIVNTYVNYDSNTSKE